jgi:hypothetical protein
VTKEYLYIFCAGDNVAGCAGEAASTHLLPTRWCQDAVHHLGSYCSNQIYIMIQIQSNSQVTAHAKGLNEQCNSVPR